MKKEHRIFIIQAVIGIIIFVVSSIVMKTIFLKDPKAQTYLDFNEGIKQMATSTDVLIDSLIANNDLTLDPSSGKDLDRVLNNLKYSEKEKLLIIGSSQMRVVQGEEIQNSYHKLVGRKIEQFTDEKYTAYNLSLGGMTTPEKLVLVNKGMEVVEPSRIIVSVTPWDALADKMRPQVKAVESKRFNPISNKIVEKENVDTETSVENDELFPINLNSHITETVDETVEDNIYIYSKRAAIKTWMEDEVKATLKGIKNGSSKEEVYKTNMPAYWVTVTQDLDNISGWTTETAQTGEKSAKITINKAQNAKWLGNDITLENPTDTFEFEGWSKAENVSADTKLYCVDFQVIFEDGSSTWYYKKLIFNKGTHDWEKVSARVRFEKKVTAIKPHLLFYGGTGTVWFDGIKAKPVQNGVVGENIIPNADFEEELKERLNVSYSYSDAEWKRIQENMFSVVDRLAAQQTKEQNVLLLAPFWHLNDKTAYPQKVQYNNLVANIKKYCTSKNILFIDASYILDTSNFGIYKQGEHKDKIDVLHFNANAHEKLAKYIIKELNL